MHINYLKFSSEELEEIKMEFDAFGYSVNEPDDFCTYAGWKQRGRRVKRGEKGMPIDSKNIYSKPIYTNGAPALDKRTGKQKFYKGTQRYTLFAIQQTEELSGA